METRVETYKREREELMKKWEDESREWLANVNGAPVKASFFKDGIIDPDKWFKSDFRPLFVLKEVHDTAEDNGCIDFVAMVDGGENQDVWNGEGMWMALGTLARGILEAKRGNGIIAYGTLRSQLNVEGLAEYRKTLRHIAIINIKKLSGGNNERSKRSVETLRFQRHASQFKENLKKQIKMIDPTVIIFCGKHIDSCFDIKENKLYDFPVVFGLHPSRSPRNIFYNNTIESILKVFC